MIDYEPAALWPPVRSGDKLFVHSIRPAGIQIHDSRTGRPLRTLAKGRLTLAPIAIDHHRLLLPYSNRVELFDLKTENVSWVFDPPGARSTIETVEFFPEAPDECIVVYNRANNLPAIVGISNRSGVERWRYDNGFPARAARFAVFRDGTRIFLIHGDHGWNLTALDVRPGATPDRPLVARAWPGDPKLGTFYSRTNSPRLHLGADILIFHDPNNSISVFDKNRGDRRPMIADQLSSFVLEKGIFASSIVGDRFVIISDGGDCAFEHAPQIAETGEDDSGKNLLDAMDLVHSWQENPSDIDRIVDLALAYFRRDQLDAAIALVDHTLTSEEGLAGQPLQSQLRLRNLVDGLKQEHMEREFKDAGRAPSLLARRLLTPPEIDGTLNDWWDVGTRTRLDSPRHVSTVPGPEEQMHWEGEEDLSATLYVGYDDTYFYFALDVTDDVLHPYDRDAESWKGDCLIIGLDPTGDMGYRQRGNDQLMTLALTLPKRRDDDKPGEEDEPPEGDSDEPEESNEEKPDGKFAVKRKSDNTGAIYEVGLPWATFDEKFEDGERPSAGFEFGLSLLLADDDTGQGATKTLSINPCQLLPHSQKSGLVWRFIIPNYFPRVKLE